MTWEDIKKQLEDIKLAEKEYHLLGKKDSRYRMSDVGLEEEQALSHRWDKAYEELGSIVYELYLKEQDENK